MWLYNHFGISLFACWLLYRLSPRKIVALCVYGIRHLFSHHELPNERGSEQGSECKTKHTSEQGSERETEQGPNSKPGSESNNEPECNSEQGSNNERSIESDSDDDESLYRFHRAFEQHSLTKPESDDKSLYLPEHVFLKLISEYIVVPDIESCSVSCADCPAECPNDRGSERSSEHGSEFHSERETERKAEQGSERNPFDAE